MGLRTLLEPTPTEIKQFAEEIKANAPSGWGLSEKIPRMHIYDVRRPKGGSGIACTHAI